MEMNEKVRVLNGIIKQIHQRSVLPIRLLDVADQMEQSFPEDASSDGIHFDRPRGVEWLNDVFQRHINELEADLLETARVTFGPSPNPPFLATRPLFSRLGAGVDSRDSSRSSRTRLPGSMPMEAEEAESSTPQSSVVSSVVVVEDKSSNQVSGSSSRLKELHERLQLRSRESPAGPEVPATWRKQPVRSVVIASYKMNTEGRYHRHNRKDWNAAQRARRDCFDDASWAEYYTQPRIPEGAVHLIVGDSLIRMLTRIQSHWQTGVLSFSGAATPQMLASFEMVGMAKMYTVTLMMGTNDVSRGKLRNVMRLHDKMSCILEELKIQMDPAVLTVCTIPYNMMADQHAMEMNEKVRVLNGIIKQIHQRSVLPIRLLDVADQMEQSFPEDASSDEILFDRPRGVEWLNDVFQRHINELEADLLETARVTFGPSPNPPFLATRPLSSRLGHINELEADLLETARVTFGPSPNPPFLATRPLSSRQGAGVDSRDSSRSSRTRLPGSTPMEAEEAESSTPQSSVVSSVVVVEDKRVEKTAEASRTRYLEKVKELDLEDLECRQELAEVLGLRHMSHGDLSRHQCVDWLKAHEAHFSRARMMKKADLTGIPTKSVIGPINYRPLKLLGSPGLTVEPPKHRTSIARIRLATPAQLRVVDKLLDPREMELPDAAYEGAKLADDPRYGNPAAVLN